MLSIRSKLLGHNFRRWHTAVLFAAAIACLIYQYMSDPETLLSSWIYWPMAYFITLRLLSYAVPFLFIQILNQSKVNLILYHLFFSILFGVMHVLVTDICIVLLERLFQIPEHFDLAELPKKWWAEWHKIMVSSLWYLLTLAGLSLIYFRELFTQERSKNISLSQDLSGAEVKTLSTELNPHFLFNAMNGIAMQVRKNENSQAIESIAHLGEMLRAVLTTKNEVFITVNEELELLDHYLSLEKRRFGAKIEINVHYQEEVRDFLVPKLLLQPIVENSFKHGFSDNMERLKIKIDLTLNDERLKINVFNTSADRLVWAIQSGKSIGLPNTVQRLTKLYEEDYSFQIKQNEFGVLVSIELPRQR